MKKLLFILIFPVLIFAQTSEYEFYGKHYIASYSKCDETAIYDLDALKRAMIKAAKASGAGVLSFKDHVFEGGGYTMVILLSESHASIHTYPEFQSCFVDLFTCGDTCKAEHFHETLTTYLKPQACDFKLIERR